MTYPAYKLHKFHLCVYYSYLINNILRQARSQAGSEQRKKNHFSADFSSTNILSIVHLWNRINKSEYTYHVASSFEHEVTSPIII